MAIMIETIGDFRRAIRNGPYAWPGGYPCYFVMSDGGALSFAAAKANIRDILETFTVEGAIYQTGWRPVALEINWEDGALTCDHTGALIECAYGDD